MAPPKKVLIVDDDPDLVEAVRMVLEAAGYEVDSAGGGDAGLKKVQESAPDLLILDVMMKTPTEGFHIAQQLKADEKTAGLPILMLTAIGERTGMSFSPDKDGDYLPVEAFMDKPVAPQDLLEKVKELLGD